MADDGYGSGEPRRSSRSKPVKAKQCNRTELRQGYDDFVAEETDDTKSGLKVTDVTLKVGKATYQGSSAGIGHAEGSTCSPAAC
jgi:hypothetical protein